MWSFMCVLNVRCWVDQTVEPLYLVTAADEYYSTWVESLEHDGCTARREALGLEEIDSRSYEVKKHRMQKEEVRRRDLLQSTAALFTFDYFYYENLLSPLLLPQKCLNYLVSACTWLCMHEEMCVGCVSVHAQVSAAISLWLVPSVSCVSLYGGKVACMTFRLCTFLCHLCMHYYNISLYSTSWPNVHTECIVWGLRGIEVQINNIGLMSLTHVSILYAVLQRADTIMKTRWSVTLPVTMVKPFSK